MDERCDPLGCFSKG